MGFLNFLVLLRVSWQAIFLASYAFYRMGALKLKTYQKYLKWFWFHIMKKYENILGGKLFLLDIDQQWA
jgi:hypothetical protein